MLREDLRIRHDNPGRSEAVMGSLVISNCSATHDSFSRLRCIARASPNPPSDLLIDWRGADR